MGSNKILPIIAGVVMLMLMFVGLKSCNSDNQDNSQLTAVPIPGVPDADSPADTIRTLTAKVAELESLSSKQSLQNESLLSQKQEIEDSLRNKLLAQINKVRDENQSQLMGGVTDQMNFFKARLEELTEAQNQTSQNMSDIPVGFGLTGGPGGIEGSSEIVWVEPLGTQTSDTGAVAYLTPSSGGLLKRDNQLSGATEKYLQSTADEFTKKDRPAYTVPRNSTLIGSTGMTALIGRIPKNGTVEDPFPFKVIVGKENLAANGIKMPGLDGMIFSGKSTGDWTLSCVRGQLHSVTYMFSDGTVRTISSDDQKNLKQQNQGSGGGSGEDRSLGWISDRRGIPCVTGTRISNATTYLSGRILASIAEAAAGAFSQGEVTNSVSALGGVTTSVITGDAVKYAGGKALSGGASEVSAYLRERMAQSFDVVYVDTGKELAIHIDVELPIDYEQNGRKTSYAYNENSEYSDLD
ncbi:MAG: TIGR03752 family integrating conjugative element protein [Methylococcaceae bacterium]